MSHHRTAFQKLLKPTSKRDLETLANNAIKATNYVERLVGYYLPALSYFNKNQPVDLRLLNYGTAVAI
ncbi:hypothetical protein NBRC116591_21880 [Sessilibacter corallicola]|uniref:Uncharacterized protein n=1 Tax=Sessilibacter corallicola TaxID=2904075 RepID=A0ABQ0A9Y4_9GAMM